MLVEHRLTDRYSSRMHPSVRRLWAKFRENSPEAPADPPLVFHFCDNKDDADLCAELVVAGRKRATATSLPEFQLGGIPLPRPGDYAVVTNWAGVAKAIIHTSSVEIRRFKDVDKDFAQEEGEGDLTLGWWRTAHQGYYQRVLANSGHAVDDDLQIVCERFEPTMRA